VKKETIALHFGYDKDEQKSMAVPIYQTTAYEYDSTEHAAALFALKDIGNIYTRIGNPTTDIFEKRFAALEGAVGALATASGMSAIFYSLVNLAQSGDNIIVSSKLYGGTITLVTHTLKRFGIEARFFDVHDPLSIKTLIDEKSKAILFESISNPSIDVADIEEIAKIADENGIISIVDNTVATAILCNPIEFGCDIIVHSTSKYTTGQGLAIGGIIAESKKSKNKLKNNPRYPHFNEPDESYHGLVYAEADTAPFLLRARLSLLRDIGAVGSPFNSWLFIQGLETLALRMQKHSSNALEIAKFLDSCKKVKHVNYPGLENDKNYKLAKKYLKGGYSGLLSFEVNSFEEAKKIVDKTKLFSLVTNIGDSKSIITHPASTTHQQLSSSELKAAGVPEGLVRLSIGLENSEDLIDDLKQAFDS
jgi:O-acetylhomoserine (thiol)-lyase